MDAITAKGLLGPDFTWGTGTSAYQIEGGATADGRGPSIWDTFCRVPGAVRNGDTGDVACASYSRWREDVALVRDLGVDAYRFSVSWPRVQPGGAGEVNEAGLDYYDRLVDGLLAAGIAPWLTLYHWDLPQALEDAGGWLARDTARRFADYCAVVASRLGDRVGAWTTLNEPWVVVTQGYERNRFAPGRALGDAALPALHHVLLAHGLGLAALRATLPVGTSCGITLDMNPVDAASSSPEDAAAQVRYDGWKNRAYADPVLLGRYPTDLADIYPGGTLDGLVAEGDLAAISAPIDFLGINYYCPHTVRAEPGGRAGAIRVLEPTYELSPPRWPDTPSGLREILVRLRDDYGTALPPLYVTENGQPLPAPDDDPTDDHERITFLDGHIAAVADAVQDGVDVRGYFVWSLLDNFEWASGYWLRFGLVHVDFEDDQRRTPKQSYAWFKDLLSGEGG